MNVILTILTCAALSPFVFGSASVVPPKQHGHLRCLETLTLKDIFDAGFRPYRLAESICSVGKADLMLSLPSSSGEIPLDVEYISFRITRTETVRGIDLQTKVASPQQTGEVLRRLAQSIGLRLTGLDEALTRTTLDTPKRLDPWTQDWSNEWLSIRFGLQPILSFINDASKGYREVRCYAVLGINWKPTEIGPTYRETRITPPKGYEHVSMDIPNSDLVKKAQASDDPSLAHLRYADEKTRQAIIESVAETVVKRQPAHKTSLLTPWSIIVVLTVAATGLLWFLLKRRS